MTTETAPAEDVRPRFTPGPWHPGHMVDPTASCNCPWISDENHMGGIAEVYMHDGMNDCPPLEEAIANAHLIAASPNLLAVALRYEAWEARFALCDDCWKSGLTQIPLELLEELRDIQKDRNVAVAKALAKARAP